MTTRVKSRTYHSPARRRQAEATRARMLAAAEALFLSRGYRNTTTAAVAGEAGVSEASVFLAFGSKAALLVAVVGAAVAGDADHGELRERPAWQRLAAEPDKVRAVSGFVRFVRRAHERTWKLLTVVRAGAEGDEVLADLARRAGESRHGDCAWFLRTMQGRKAPGREVDLLWTLTGVDVYRSLIVERRWSAARYERWLRDTLCRELGIGDS